jgi:hypothetical protein
LLIAAAVLVGAPAAMAQLPGGSAVDEYTENVPGAGGDQPSGHSSSGGTGGNSNDGSGSSGTGSTPTAGGSATPSAASPSEPSQSSTGETGSGPGASGGSASQTTSTVGGSSDTTASRTNRSTPTSVPATLTSQPVPVATDRPRNNGDISAAWPLALLVVALASVGIYWYRRRYPETLIQRPGRTPQRLPG